MKKFINLIKSQLSLQKNTSHKAAKELSIPTVNRRSTDGQSQCKAKAQVRFIPENSPIYYRVDSVSIVSRQSDLAKYVATLAVLLCLGIGNVWGAASTSSDSKYATGTITFADFGSMSATTNYWYNGVKIYSGASQSASASNSRWATSVSVPTYISNVNAGNSTNKISWGSNGAGKQYSMSGLALNTHAIGIHVNGKCTVTVVIDKNIASDTDDAGISASVDATAYGTAWTSDTYKTAGTALTVTSSRADKANYPGRYTLTIPISTDGEKVIKIFNSSSGTGAGKLFCYESITVTAAGCSGYSFHYGTDGQSNWATECFVAQGDEHEMQLEDFTIPSTTHFYVGKNSEFHGTSGNAGDANSVTTTWSSMYFATSIGDGTGTRPMLGQATGATGTIRIYDNSTWNNKQAAFIPDGYKLKVGSTEYAFAVEAGNEYRSDIVELSSSNARSNISVGITNSSGNYVATDNTEEMQHLFLNTGGTSLWSTDNASNFAIYDDTDGHKYFTCLMTKVPGEDYLYEGWVPSSCTKVIFCRMASTSLEWGDANSNVWNYVLSKSLETNKNLFTISSWSDGAWSAYEKKGKFRMNADWVDKNWYVRFNPYHVLTYDANGGSGAPAAQSVAADAVPCQWTLSTTQPTWADHVFLGWSTNSSAAEPDAASEVADLGTPYSATGDVTLYAVWTACSGPNGSSSTWTAAGYTYNQGDAANTMSLTGVVAGNGGALSYQWYKTTSDVAHGEAISGATSTSYTPSTSVAHAEVWYYFCVVTEAGCSTTYTSSLSGAIVVNAATYTLTVSGASVANPMTEESKTGAISGVTITGSPVSGITSGTTTSTSDNTFTVNKGTPVTVTASATVAGSAAECDECTYRFKEWTNVPASVTANVSNIQAVYNTTYTIAFRETDGTTIAGVSDTYYVYGTGKTVATFPTPTKSGYEFGGWYKETTLTNAATDLSSSDYGNVTYYAKWIEIATLTCGTLYKVGDMVPASITLSTTGQYASGLSSNGIFTTIGDPSKTDGAAGTPEMKNESSTTIAGESFIGRMYFKGASNTTGSGTTFVPTSRAIKFAIAKNGTLDIYAHRVDRLYLKKAGESGTTQLGSSTSSTPSKVSHSVTAGTYYIYSVNSSDCVYGMQLNCAYTVTYKANGSGESDEVDDDAKTIAANPFTWSGHTFVGWNTADDGSGTPYTVGATVTSDLTLYAQWKSNATVYAFSNGSFGDWGTCNGGTLTLSGSQSGVNYQLYKDGVASGDAKAGTGSALNWTVTASGTYTVKSVENASYGETAMTGTAVVTLQDPALSGSSTVNIGSTITLTHPGYLISGGSWTSSNGSVATVVDGVVTGVAAGTATITFHGVGACDGSKEITVTEPSDCEDLAAITATSTSALTATVGSVSYGSMTGGDGISIDGYSYSVKFNSSGHVDLSPKAGETFAAGDSLIVVIYNHGSSEQAIGFKIGSNDYTATTDGRALHYFRQTLVAANISDGKVIINRSATNGSSGYIVAATIKRCGMLPSCTTPTLPSLSDQTVCPGNDIEAWDATPTNASAISAAGESVSYSWKKKGNDTELATTASFDLGSSATEGQAGTYVVKVTVSKVGNASASASAEVDLVVTPATETPSVSANKAKVYQGDAVTLTATCGSTGITWEWYQCSDAVGTITGSKLSSTNSYTISSAPTAGTYYYKAVAKGDGINSCGDAEYVYTLTVSAPSECENYFWFVYADDATSNGVINNRDGFFSGTKTGSSNQGSYKFTLDGTEYTATRNTGSSSISISFTVPTGATATLAMNAKSSSSNTVTLSHSSGTPSYDLLASGSYTSVTKDEIGEGTWTLTAPSNWTLAGLGVHVCSTSTCTDAIPTATATNTTVCSGTALSITATGYEESPTSIQWQKLNSSTSTWDNISGATEATYTVASATAADAGSYRVVVTKGCARTSNTVTISVPSAPNFGSTVPASVSVMQTIALSINTVEATDAVKYRWYKSADATWDAGDVEIGTNKELIKAYDSEAIGSPSYYIFCRAQNACGITTSSAIAVNVIAYVEEDCATRGNENDAEFDFENTSMTSGTYNNETAWSGNQNSKYLTYIAPTGKNFAKATVTIATSGGSNAAYAVYNGSSWTYYNITGMSSSWQEKEFTLPANTTKFQIGRRLDDKGTSSGTFYLHEACFEYTETCTSTSVTPSTASVNYEMGGAWSNPTFSLTPAAVSGETLTYTSSNEDIASVDDDGTVTFNGDAGTVTITASYAGGTISETDYCASSGSYTITVSCTGGAPKVVASGTTVGCSSSITLQAKKQDGTAFADGTYQWFRNGEEIDGATGNSYTATQAGTYTVERTNTSDCTTPSTNSAVVTSETTEPEVERLVPFQYYHVDKTYSDQMKMRHLFAVKNSGTLDGKSFKMYVSRNGSAATDVTSSAALVVKPNGDGHVDTVKVDLNKLRDKYSENDELVFTCKAIDCSGNVSDVYKNTITMRVIGATPTLALICSGSSKAEGTRKTGELTVGGDFLTGYNVADLCQQTGNTSFDANTEWGLYTDLKAHYIVTPVNGYAVFNKLNYEPFDILLLTDYPKASKSDAAKDVLDDMAALCDYRPMLSFKTHMVAKSPSKWAAKGFTTSPVVTKADGRLNLNIVCYAHPMFEHLKDGANVYRDADNSSELVYTMLSGTGYESSKGMQGFEIDAAENFVTIGLTHYNASAAPNTPSTGNLRWTPGSEDRMLVTVAERQTNIEARFILFSLNCGAQSKLTDKGEEVILACLEYLLDDDPLHVADCSFTFDNGANAPHDADWYKVPANCPGCSGTLGDGLWSTEANWGPERINIPEEFTSARIAAPVTVDLEHAKAMELRIIDEGSIDIPAGKALDVKSTIRRMDGSEIYPTDVNDILIGSSASGNGTLIFNNNSGDTKARVLMYSTAQADIEHMSAATSTWQYIGTPHNDVAIATYNYYDSWLYQYDTDTEGWIVIPNGGPLVPFRGYCVTHPNKPNVYDMAGTLVATTSQEIAIPAGKYVVVANSWVAPIDINAITDDDMENITDKTIYFFNTGSDTEGTGGTGTAAGTYRATPINAASYTGDWQIPSMQGFYVVGGSSNGTLHLDYNRHVRPTGDRTIVSNPMYAPRRAGMSDEPEVAKLFFRGHRYYDKLVVLEREDFTRGYDSGWDGEAWGGNDAAPMSYVSTAERWDAVSAIPEFEGTVVGFRAGEDTEYTIDFEYSEENAPLYLLDTQTQTYTRVLTGNAYHFTTSDKGYHDRFIFTRSNGEQTPTGIEPTSDSSQKGSAQKLLINEKVYILRNGVLYDATGKVVK